MRRGTGASEAPRAGLSPADLLSTARRLDWRFLLPDPRLGRVACAADLDPALIAACRVFAESVTVLSGTDEDGWGSHDLVALSAPPSSALDRARALLRPGGWVYIEIRPHAERHRGRGRPRFAFEYAASLRRRGFDDVAAHWHWPTFAACTQILPLDDRAVVRAAFRRRQQSRRRSLGVALARLLLETRVLPLVVRDASVIGRYSPGQARP